MPKVSIVVPVHNTADLLPRCVNSLTAQRLSDIEIILVENCSTDGSLGVCKTLAEADNRIKVMSIEQGDPSIARNEGIKVATGDYIGFVDSDDFISPDMYYDMYDVAAKHNLGLVCCTFHMVYDDGSTKCRLPNDGTVEILDAKEMTILNLNDKISKVFPTLLVRRDLFENFTIPAAMFFEDRASTHLLTARSGRAAIVKRAYYSYYSRRGSRMHLRHEQFRRMLDFIRATYWRLEFIRKSELFSDAERVEVSRRCAEQYLRKSYHLLRLADNAERRAIAKEWCGKADEIIPRGVRLPLRARVIRWYLHLIL